MIKTVIFIGMAGVGKTSIGKLVSQHFKLRFIDTDKVISNAYNASLPEVISKVGEDEFKRIEAQYVCDSMAELSIVSPGGSFIYAVDTIEKIKDEALFIYLFDEPNNIKKRILNLHTRGIVGLKDKTFEQLCFERHKLYEKAANIQFNLNHDSFDDVTEQIIEYLTLLLK